MSRKPIVNSFLHNGYIALFFKGVGAGLTFAVHVIMGHLLGSEGYGIFGMATALAAFGSLFAVFGYDNASIRFIPQYLEQKDWARLRGFIRAAYLQGVVGTLLMMLLGLCVLWSDMFPNSQTVLVVMIVLIIAYVFVPLLSKIIRGFNDIAGSLWVEQVLFPVVTLLILGIFGELGFAWVIGAFVVGRYSAVVASLLVVRQHVTKYLPPEYTYRKDLRRWYGVATPLFFAALINVLYLKADTLMVGLMVSYEQTGLYTSASKVAILLSFVLGVVGIAVAPMLSSSYHGGRIVDFRRLFYLSLLFSASVSLLIFLLIIYYSSEIMLLYGGDFEQASDILVVLAGGQFVNAITGPVTFALMVSGNERIYARTMLIGGVANIGLNILLIPYFDFY